MTHPLRIDPRLKEWATDRQKELIDAVELHGSASAAAKALGINKAYIPATIKSLAKRAAQFGYSPDHRMIHTVPDGYKVRGVSTLYDREGSVRAQWVKSAADDERRFEIMKAHIEGAREEIRPEPPVAPPEYFDEDLLALIPMGDPHAGLYAWEAETGQRFDLAEFERIQCAAIDRLAESIPPCAVIVFNDKGDTTHADNNKNRTPRSGNDLDVHGRHYEAVRLSVRVKRYQIRRLLARCDRLIVRIDPGNHDPETALHLALVLEALYEAEPRVEVITSPNPFWYYLWGSTLIGTCHGDGAKGRDLPLLMATDQPKAWGEADYRVWFVGHVHHKDVTEYNGCTVEYVGTLAASDAWHHGQGYRPRRTLEAIVLHRQDNEVERHTQALKRIERLTGKAA